MTMKTVAYLRVSTKAQAGEDRYSLAEQERALRAHCEHEGHDVLEMISDPGYSGATLNRPGMDRVRDLVSQGGVDLVIATDRDRFAREPAYHYLLKREFKQHGTRLRALNDQGDDSPEGELTDGVLDQIAKYQRAKTARLTRNAKVQRVREGKVMPGTKVPYGLALSADRTNFVPDPATMPTIQRVFSMVADGASLYAVKKVLDDEGVPTPGGGRFWYRSVLRRMIENDVYRALSHAELGELAAEGALPRPVYERLDPERSYSVWYFNKERTTMAGGGPGKPGPKRTYRSVPRSEWVAVPVPDPGVPRVLVDAARGAIRDNVKSESAGRRFWELKGFAYCPCGCRMSTHSTSGRRKSGLANYYTCGRKRNSGRTECKPNKYHRAEPLEERVSNFVLRVLADPETMRKSIEEQLERERAAFQAPQDRIRGLADALFAAGRKRERYQEMYANDAMTLEELKAKISAVDAQKKTLEAELARLKDTRAELERLERLAGEIPEFLADLPYLVDRSLPVRGYETVPPERGEDGPLPVYTLTPERIRERTPEEVEARRQRRERERAERFAWVYGELGLKVVVRKDGELELSGVFGHALAEHRDTQATRR